MPRTGHGHALHPDSRRLVTADADARRSVWDAKHATPTETLEGLTGQARQLAIAPDGRTAYTAGHDCSVTGWDLTRARR
jgi:WD40 repeat protein